MAQLAVESEVEPVAQLAVESEVEPVAQLAVKSAVEPAVRSAEIELFRKDLSVSNFSKTISNFVKCFLAFVLSAVLPACSIDAVIDRPVSKDDIRETIKAHQKDIRICYENALEQTPMLEGRIVMDWTIGGDGHPKDLKVRETSPKIQAVAPCLTESMKTWVFRNTRPDSVVTVSYPFIFSENSQFERVRKETAPSGSQAAVPEVELSSGERAAPFIESGRRPVIAPRAPKGAKDSKTE